mmetsp:Transcript_33584/g.61828  ORF Transcript_33584/g.61828 Transcript_33584/m.61828 type:complete len:439 (+) Transcript_33584:46-1362(+)
MSTPPPPQVTAVAPPSMTINKTRTINNKNHDIDPYFTTLESIMRVTVSGLGGFLVGMSLARHGSGGGAAARQAASAFSKIPRRSDVGTSSSTSSSIATKSNLRGLNKKTVGVGNKNAIGHSGGSGGGTAMTTTSKGGGGGGKRLQRQNVIRTTPPSTGPYVDQELPYTWAIAVMTFVGILEFTRVTSPTTFLWELARGDSESEDVGSNDSQQKHDTKDSDNTPPSPPSQQNESYYGSSLFNNTSLDPSIATIVDLVIGGSIAGALFRGSAVRTRVGARIDASIMGISKQSSPSTYLSAVRGRPLSGLLPGAALGMLAGVVTVAADRAQVAVKDYFGDADADNEDMVGIESEDGAVTIPADIKAMSNEELMKSIEKLKSGRSESQDAYGDDAQVEVSSKELSQTLAQSSVEGETEMEDGEEAEMQGLISSLGFRPHPSQ